MKKIAELLIKLLSAISHAVECAVNLYHAVRAGLSALASAFKEQMNRFKNKCSAGLPRFEAALCLFGINAM